MTQTTKRGRGRPSTGTPIMVRVPEPDLEHIDAAAQARGITRAEYIRQLIHQDTIPPVTGRRRHRT